MQDGDDFVFMDMTTFDTETVPKDVIGTSLALASITIMQLCSGSAPIAALPTVVRAES